MGLGGLRGVVPGDRVALLLRRGKDLAALRFGVGADVRDDFFSALQERMCAMIFSVPFMLLPPCEDQIAIALSIRKEASRQRMA